jgi:radical SAM protein with 4Fe4S-binding SPASM domain
MGRKGKASFKQKVYQAFKILFVAAGKSKEIDGYFRVEKFSRTLKPLHFSQVGVSVEEKQAFFKKELRSIEFETHAYCNRTCSFCPNSFLDRRNKSQLMPEEMFKKILSELKAFDFAGQVKLQRYNEPLANDIIFDRVAQTREALPHADLSFHTNGDYVTIAKLEKLEKAGLNEVFVSLYPDYDKDKDRIKEAGHDLCHAFLKRVGITHAVEAQTGDHPLGRYVFDIGRLKITAFAFNLMESGNDRGGTLKDLSIKVRRSPCESPFSRLYVDWTGDVFPCCNLRTDVPEHKDYVMGNVKQESLMDIFFSKTGNFMRRELAIVSDKSGVCSSCKFDVMCSNKHAESLLNKTMERMGAIAA